MFIITKFSLVGISLGYMALLTLTLVILDNAHHKADCQLAQLIQGFPIQL